MRALAFVAAHWRVFAMVGLFGIIASYAGCEHAGRLAEHQGRQHDAEIAAQTLARARSDVAQCHQTISTLNGSLDRQNASLEAARLAAVDAETRQREAAQRASVALAAAHSTAAAVLAGRPGVDRCVSALAVARAAP